jgi:DNA repair exonuclease SbcCD ATPase subunit
MSKGKNFNDFTYGVGLEINATSFKQVKDDLKVNLDSLSKMVKSYSKVLKIDPNADLSKLFEEMRKVKSIVDGINHSDNSFAGFVDKGVLGRIESLESSLKAVGDTSTEIKSNIESLKTSIVSLVEPLKAAGQIKFPATFENLFGDITDQSAQIKNVTNTIKTVESNLAKLKTMWESLGSLDAKTDWNDTEILNWIKRIEEIQDELSRASDIDPKKLQKFVIELDNIGSKLGSAMASMSEDKLAFFRIDEEYVVDSINDVINIIEKKKVQLEEELRSLNEIQTKFNAKNQMSSSSRSLGVQSDYTAQVKVAPKTNEAEWISKINDTITNITGQLKPVKLTPTFSKSSKNIEKEISEGAAQINHAIKVDFQIVDDLDNSFDARIKEIDNRIKSAKNQIEQNAKFKLSFTYDENEDFKKSAYEVINKFKEDFKQFETTFVIKDEKAFLEKVSGLRQKIKAELKGIPVNFEEISVSFLIKDYDKFLSSVDKLKTDIVQKIGNIDVNLNIANLPQFMAQAVMMRDAVEKAYSNHPVGLGIGPSTENVGVEGAAKNIEELSDAAKAAKEDLEKCKSVLKSLSEQGFNAPEFLQLGDITSQGKNAKGSTKKLEELLNKYKTLKAKTPDDIGARWAELYPEANGDLVIAAQMARKVEAELKQVESELNLYLQKQIAYMQNRLEQSEKVLQTEKKIVSTKKDQAGAKQDDKTEVQSNKQLAMSAEEAAKKVKSLSKILTEQKKMLKDLEINGIGSASFIKLGEWDKKSGSFKKNKKEIQELVNKYNELKAARKQSGETKAVGEEKSLMGKLSSILRQQKQHASEIIAQNQAELKSVKEISKAYKDVGKSKKESAKVQKDTKSTKEIDELTARLNKAKEALELLQTKKLEALSMTGLGDKKHRLDSIGSSQNFDELIKEYNLLIAKRNELEKSGMDITHPEYVAYAKQYQGVEQQLNVIYNDQLKYTQSRVKYYETQISKAQQLLQLEQKQTEEEKQQAQIDSTGKKTKSSVASGAVSSNVVKLDGSTLNSLAKDATLKSIDGKINNIVSRLGKGMNITGSNISINASNVNLKGSNKNIGGSSGRKPAAGDKEVKATTLSSYARQLTTFEEQIKRSGLYTEEFENRLASLHRTLDKVSVQKDFDAYKIGLDRFKEEFEQLKTYDKLYQDFVQSQSKQIQLKHDISASNGPTAEMQEQLKIEEQISNGLENQLTQYTTLYTQRTRQLAIEEAIRKANQEIAKSTAAQSDKAAKQQNKELVKIVDSAQNKLKEMQYSMQNSKVPMVDVAIKKFGEYEQLLSTLKLKQQAIIADPDLLKNEGYAEGFNDLLRQMKKVEEEFTTLQKSSENFLKKISNIEDIKPLDKTFNNNDLEQMHDAMQDFANQASIGAAKLIEFNDAEQTATFAIKDGKGHVQQLTVAYDVATNSLGRYTSQTRESMSETQKFLNSLKHSFQNVARYVASFGSIYELFAIIKRGITYVKDIDSALTELKKVTDETDASYAQFLQDMSKTGKVVGATVADLTTMASEWARLGYSMEEAGKLAQSTAVLLNVSEFDDATKASEALISTMQAFQYTAEESGHVVDILNEIGKFIACR